MNFNPQNEQGLLGLVTALKSGMDPSTAYGIYQNIAQDQATSIARRQERLSGLAGLLMNAASSGATYDQASILADAQAGPAGPAVQNMLNTYYPYGNIEEGSSEAVNFTQNGPEPLPAAVASGAAPYGGGSVSPVYAGPDPAEQMAQQTAAIQQEQAAVELQQSQQEASLSSLWTSLASDAAAAKAQGMDLATFITAATSPDYPQYQQLVGQYPDEFKKVVGLIFGQVTV